MLFLLYGIYLDKILFSVMFFYFLNAIIKLFLCVQRIELFLLFETHC